MCFLQPTLESHHPRRISAFEVSLELDSSERQLPPAAQSVQCRPRPQLLAGRVGEAGKKPLRQHVDAVGEDSGPFLAGVVPSRQWRGSTPRRLFSTALSVLYGAGSSRRLFSNSSSVLFPLLRHGLGRALGLKPKMQPRNRVTICSAWLCFALLGRVVRHFLFCSIELQHWQERRCSTGIAFAGSKRLRCGTRCCLCSNPRISH